MGRPRTPTAILEAKGSYKKDPQRRRPPSPVSNTPIGSPPDWLADDEAEIWVDVVRVLPEKVATEPDKFALAMFCRLYGKVQRGEAKNADYLTAMKILSCYGMTPSDRSRVVLPAEKKDNPFSRFKPT